MREKYYGKGDVIFREGDRGNSMFRILEGTVSIHISALNGEDITLTQLGKDAIFGEMAILEEWPRSAAVVAESTPTRLLEISSQEVTAFFREDPSQIKAVMSNLSHRLRSLTLEYLDVCDTVREMRDTYFENRPRSESLLSRLGKFLGIHSRVSGHETPFLDHDSNALTGAKEDASVKESSKSSGFHKGEVLFREGDQGDCMYFVEKGSVAIVAGYGTEQEKRLAVVSTNGFFGEMGMIEKLPRTAAAVIRDDHTKLRVIKEDELDKLFEESPVLILLCLQHLSSRLRALTREYLLGCETLAHMKEAEDKGATLSEQDMKRTDRYSDTSIYAKGVVKRQVWE